MTWPNFWVSEHTNVFSPFLAMNSPAGVVVGEWVGVRARGGRARDSTRRRCQHYWVGGLATNNGMEWVAADQGAQLTGGARDGRGGHQEAGGQLEIAVVLQESAQTRRMGAERRHTRCTPLQLVVPIGRRAASCSGTGAKWRGERHPLTLTCIMPTKRVLGQRRRSKAVNSSYSRA